MQHVFDTSTFSLKYQGRRQRVLDHFFGRVCFPSGPVPMTHESEAFRRVLFSRFGSFYFLL